MAQTRCVPRPTHTTRFYNEVPLRVHFVNDIRSNITSDSQCCILWVMYAHYYMFAFLKTDMMSLMVAESADIDFTVTVAPRAPVVGSST